MEESLPTEYDVIVVGTGMVESIVAAAVSRLGKKTLHLDANKYYGQNWATFNLEHFLEWINSRSEVRAEPEFVKNDEFKYINTNNCEETILDVRYKWDTTVDEEIENKTLSSSRKFNIDITPKLILSKGPMVKLLLDSEVSRYVEFLNIANILIYLNAQVEPVPYSKSDVFSTRTVNVVEKRILMRILTQIQEHKEDNDKFESYRNKTFFDFLKDQKLPENISLQILYCIAMVTENTGCLEGVKKAQDFLNSLGFYGNSPFLWTMYGSSDLLQAFCRLCAVFGGTYCLDMNADEIIIKENLCRGIVSNGKHLHADKIVMSSHILPTKLSNAIKTVFYFRAILITDSPLYKKDKNGVSLLHFPVNGKSPIKIIELDSSTASCPKDLFVVHLIGMNSKEEISEAIECLFNGENSPKVIFQCEFSMKENKRNPSEEIPSNLYPCSGPTPYDIDYQSSIDEAKFIFNQMFPDEVFFGPLPPQEDIEMEPTSQNDDEKQKLQDDISIEQPSASDESKT